MNVSFSNFVVEMERPAQGIRDLKKAGFDSLVTGLGVWQPDFYGYNKIAKKPVMPKEKDMLPVSGRYSLMFSSCREENIEIPLVYGPSYGLIDPTKNRAIKDDFLKEDGSPDLSAIEAVEEKVDAFVREAAKECIAFAGQYGVKYMLIQPVVGDRTQGREWEVNHDFYMSLAGKARETGICILLKNMCRYMNGHPMRGICADAAVAADWIDKLNAEAGAEVFGFCVDMSACGLCGNDVHDFVVTLEDRIKAVLLRECDGRGEAGLMPFSCSRGGKLQTDWMGLIRGLRDIDFDGELVVDGFSTMEGFSPLLRPTLFRLAKEVGDYIRWQVQLEQNLKKYKSIVLFGAGNMCRNYMKCYGEQYPPLFTCDNNPKLWNTEFEGLTVKNPEELRNLSEDCGVYICNIYYREIEAQLKEMGIKNIEYFNDEYMPTFYFDRLERDEE